MFSKDATEPLIKISSLQRITESERETSSSAKGSGEGYLVIDQDLGDEERESSQVDEKSNGSLSSSAPVLSDVHTAKSSSSNDALSRSRSPVPSFDVIGTDEIIKALPISRVTGLESASEAAKEMSTRDTRLKAESQFMEDYDYHFDALMIQLIKSFGLSLSWLQVVKPLVMEAAKNVKTNVFPDDVMDINHYVKVKKIPGGRQSNSNLVYGVVCTKNVTHKKMETSVKNPTVLLLKCAFEFQRRENTLSYFDTLQLQEEQYLKNVVAKVKAFKPDVILVQKSMSRLAMEMLYELGIVVVVNVKQTVMNRVARCTEGTILSSLDQLFFDVRLGKCGHFHIRNYTLPDGIKKTLMYFDLCERQYGCVITLQGASNRELKKVKKVTQFGLHIAHNSNLEMAFLVDEFAWPRSGIAEAPKLLPSDDDDGYSPTPSTPEWPLYPSMAYPLDAISPTELIEKLRQLGLSHEEEEGAAKEAEGEEDEERNLALFQVICEEKEEDRDDLASAADSFGASAPSGRVSSSHSPSNLDQTKGTGKPETSDEPMSLSECEVLEKVDTVGDEASLERVESGLILKLVTDNDDQKQAEEETATATDSLVKLAEDKTLEEISVVEFQKAMEGQILSVSPGVKLTTPYLQTVEGRRADARQYLPTVIYWSSKFNSGLTRSQKVQSSASKNLHIQHKSSDVEMGLTKATVNSEERSMETMQNENGIVPYQYRPSYKSVSAHPLTTSIFLLQANTNEMKSALADYRARASLPSEEDYFFFPSAQVASDYKLHLQNVFNAYRHFNFEVPTGAEEESKAEVERKGNKSSKKIGRRFPWKRRGRRDVQIKNEQECSKLSPVRLLSTSDNPLEADEEDEEEGEGEGEEDQDERGESAEPAEQDAESAEIAKPAEPTTAANLNGNGLEKEIKEKEEKDVPMLDISRKSFPCKGNSGANGSSGGGSHKARPRGEGSTSSRFSDKCMILEDFDKGHMTMKPLGPGETEEDSVELSYEQWVARDQVR